MVSYPKCASSEQITKHWPEPTDCSCVCAAELFKVLGKGDDNALLVVVILGAVNIVATLVAMFFSDRIGRRPLLLQGSCQMVISFIIVAIIMAIGFDKATGVIPAEYARVIIAFQCFFTSGFAWSWGPLGWLVSVVLLFCQYHEQSF